MMDSLYLPDAYILKSDNFHTDDGDEVIQSYKCQLYVNIILWLGDLTLYTCQTCIKINYIIPLHLHAGYIYS